MGKLVCHFREPNQTPNVEKLFFFSFLFVYLFVHKQVLTFAQKQFVMTFD